VSGALSAGLRKVVSARIGGARLPRRPIAFLASFLSTKSVAFFGLLWAARVVSPATYGTIELCLAVGTIVGTAGLVGVHGAAPRLALTMGEEKIDDLLAFATFALSATMALVSVVVWSLGWPPLWACFAGCSATAAAQGSLAAYARTSSLPIMNSLVDASATIAMVVAVAVLDFAAGVTVLQLARVFTGLAFVVAAGSFGVFRLRAGQDFFRRYGAALGMGWRMQVFGLASVSIGAGLRPLLALTFPLSALGVYSVCFRIANLLLLFHQVVTTYVFAALYRAASRGFDLFFTLALGFLSIMTAGIWAVLPILIHRALPAYVRDLALVDKIFPLVGAQVVLWIGAALLESRTNRFGRSTAAAVAGLCGILAYAALYRLGGLAEAVWLFDLMLGAFALFQVWQLWRSDDRLPMTAGSILAVTAAASVVAFV
jgi:hypothetical protein